jgi:hypothetical protein
VRFISGPARPAWSDGLGSVTGARAGQVPLVLSPAAPGETVLGTNVISGSFKRLSAGAGGSSGFMILVSYGSTLWFQGSDFKSSAAA